MASPHRLSTKGNTDLRKVSCDPPAGITQEEAREGFERLALEIGRLQELLYSASTHRMLVVLQGMDTSGKDGTIRKVFRETDPLGCRAISFKAPSDEERAHDFLWRIHRATPARGHMNIFNRSQYEDVLIARVRDLVPKSVWSERYAQINDYERMLVETDTILLKIFLHIDKHEQEKRLLAREKEVEKSWKLTAEDWKERQFWDDYMDAYNDALSKCATEHAPWHVIPANKKWYRNFAIARIVHDALEAHEEDWRAALADQARVRRAEIAKFKKVGGKGSES